MLFARRIRPTTRNRLRQALWPRTGFHRAAKYLGYRVLRLPGTPHSISGGIAWGAAMSFTPFIGFHVLLAIAGAWLTRCSTLAAVAGTAVGNPWTIPLILAWIYQCGVWMLGGEAVPAPAEHSLRALFVEFWDLLGGYLQWVVGLRPAAEISSAQASAYATHLAEAVLWPMAVGSVPNFIVVWFAFYLSLKYLVVGYRRARAARLRGRIRAERLEEGDVPNI